MQDHFFIRRIASIRNGFPCKVFASSFSGFVKHNGVDASSNENYLRGFSMIGESYLLFDGIVGMSWLVSANLI